jgi:hypothetical protein
MKVAFRRFTSSFQSWESMLTEVAEFAAGVGRENLINISCSEFGQHSHRCRVVLGASVTGLGCGKSLL